ncbi:hypothetical protein DFH09DRAFT_114194 [Mycena vulgaris]|nr:hypothetical protein DFH09DRAFT_114194 [Mycena vulgaris]
MPPRKKTAVADNGSPASRRSRGRGKLRMLPEMPLDILFEIFSCLDPPDVLRLARTTKDLRNVLMRRSAISIWKSAFLNDPDLPGVPDGLNEPQYANLAFSPHCHFCFIAGEHNILWAFRVRACNKCLVGRYDEVHKVTKKLSGLSGNAHLLRHARATLPTGSRFIHSHEEAAEINKQLIQLKKGDASKLEGFVAERIKLVEEIHSHAQKAEMSVQLRLARKQRMLQGARDRRKEAICTRLRDLGYAEEVQYINDNRPERLSEHPLIKSNSELTDRVWDNMKPQLIELMQGVRENMKRKQRKSLLKTRQRLLLSILKEYIHEQPIDEINPRAVDFCVMSHIKAMVEDPSMDAYTTEESFQEVLDDLPRFFKEWRESKTRDLLALLPAGRNSRDCLLRATTYFRCSECSEPIAYPRVLAHACLSQLRHGHRNRDDDIALLCVNLDSEPWNYDGKRVSYYPAAEASARSVVRGCGLDTDMTTAQDMDDVNPWLECLRCTHKVKGRAIFRWRKAILHDMYHAASAETVTWQLLDEDDSEAAEALQRNAYQTDCRSDVPDYVCKRCRQQFSFLHLRGHFRVSHGIEDPDDEEDYALQVDASMDQPPFPLMLPHAAKTQEVIEIADDDGYELEYIGSYIVIDE